MPMRIDSSFPTHVARAYGLKLVRPAESAAKPSPAQPTKPTAPMMPTKSASPVTSTMSIGPAPATKPAQPMEKVSQLLAGKVAGPVDFSAGPRAASGSDAMQLYTRSADRIEAATAVQIGRQLDVKA